MQLNKTAGGIKKRHCQADLACLSTRKVDTDSIQIPGQVGWRPTELRGADSAGTCGTRSSSLSRPVAWTIPPLGPSSALGNMEALDNPAGSPGPLGCHFPVLNFKKERLGTQPAMTLGKRTGKK